MQYVISGEVVKEINLGDTIVLAADKKLKVVGVFRNTVIGEDESGQSRNVFPKEILDVIKPIVIAAAKNIFIRLAESVVSWLSRKLDKIFK